MKLYIVDAFTNKPFSGNPAAVCLLDENKDDGWLLNVAAEMNLSETAFLRKAKPGGEGGYNLRWFTPEVEVDLCGHATLASAHILWETMEIRFNDEVIFHTRSGILKAYKYDNEIMLDFPAIPQSESKIFNEIKEALGIDDAKYFGKSEYNYLIELNSDEEVKSLKPDFDLLRKLPAFATIVTGISRNKKYDFVSRFFAPAKGIKEDPVTGSAHCILGPYWSKRLKRNEMTAYQASKRGGFIKIRVEDQRVMLIGQAVTILKGDLII
jgi:PhzF family phenazine biosynthesis protein